jgi:hypothetical protein
LRRALELGRIGEQAWLQQAQQQEVGVVVAFVGRGGEKQHVLRALRQRFA